MADPVLIQKQIKDNSEDLHNFVRDLKLWEEEMKRKDRQLSNDQSEAILPPVRRAKTDYKTSNPSKKQNVPENKPQRIRSSDYKSWEKFDVDKACEEVDGESKQNEEEEDTDSAEQEEKYLKEKALYEKELGNQYVKASKWDSAIEAYSKAITAYPKDPIFFANRALCYLKKKKFEEVESDCTESLKLDTTYVKAYMRRAAAREALGRLEDARLDLRQVLRLEPNNAQAQQDLERVSVRVNKSATVVNGITSKDAFSSGISQNNTLKNYHTPHKKENKDSVNKKATELGTKKLEFKEPDPEPSWTPCDQTLEPVSKPPHLRSKKSLKRIEIQDVDSSLPEYTGKKTFEAKQVASIDQTSSEEKEKTLIDIGPSSLHEEKKMEVKPELKTRSILTINTPSPSVPPPPKSSVQFHTLWKAIKHDSKLCYQFLKQIPGEELPDIFKESLESRMFSSIVDTLVTEFITAGDPVLSYLRGLSSVRRFSTISLFMSAADKSNLTKLFQHCISRGDCSSDDINYLRRLYEM